MPKRKRENDEDDLIARIEDRAVRIKASRLQANLEQSNKILKDAIQLARGFERQKLSRRQKQADKQPHTLLRLREEVIVVKGLDPTKVAKDYLFKQLVKTKRIKESPPFVALFGDDPEYERSQSTAEGNVLARLFKSNPVKEVLPEILRSIKNILVLDEGKSTDQGAELTRIAKTSHDDGDIPCDDDYSGFSSENDEGKFQPARAKLLEGISLDDVSDDGVSDDENDIIIDNNKNYAVYNEHQATTTTKQSRRFSTLSTSDSDEAFADRSTRETTFKNTTVNEKPSRTAFLPSLSMGGYYSGSESGDDDGFGSEVGTNAAPQRKNRRGQRARQEIAAKKYGRKANHLVNGKGQAFKGRDAGWDSKRGAVGSYPRYRGSTGPTGANGDTVNTEKARQRRVVKTADKPLHPSWEAARKKKVNSVTASFAGKKTTFD